MNQLDSIPYHEHTDQIQQDTPGAWRVSLGQGSWTWVGVPFFTHGHEVLAQAR